MPDTSGLEMLAHGIAMNKDRESLPRCET